MSSNEANPYSAPADLEISPTSTEPEIPLLDLAKRTFLCWEKLRIIYVGVLALVTLLVVARVGRLPFRALIQIIEGAIAANVLYLAGPSIDTYIRWLGYKAAWPRWLMFVGGTLLSMLLASAILHKALT